MKLHTFGYSNDWTPELVKAAAMKLDAIVVDIRYNPTSRKAQWRQKALEKVLGSRYQWCKSLGNVNYRGGEIELYRPDAGVAQIESIIERGKSVILMCTCRNIMTCHRHDAGLYVSAFLELGYKASESEIYPSDYELQKPKQMRLF